MVSRVLLTGGAGFIGSHTYVALVKAGYDVTILDSFENAREDVPDRLASLTGKRPRVIVCDVTDRNALQSAVRPGLFDAAIHFAARKSVPESEANPLGYYQNNVGGLINFADAVRRSGITNLVFSSSAAVYGRVRTLPISEEARAAPLNTYAETKHVGEAFLGRLAKAYPEMRIGILRYFNPVGAHPSGFIGEAPTQPPGNLMPVLARVAAGQLDRLRIFGGDYPTKDGTAVRDYVHVMDLAEGHVLSLHTLLRKRISHLVNLGTGQGYSVLEMLRAYSAAVGRDLPYEIVDRRAGDAAASYADATRARQILGFKTKFGLQEMCETSWAFYSREVDRTFDPQATQSDVAPAVGPTAFQK